MSKTIVVFGATGSQGGSVARSLANDPEYHIRAVSSDGCSVKSQELKELGMEVVEVNLDDRQSIGRALYGAYGSFVVTITDHTEGGFTKEKQEGLKIADECLKAGLEHVIFSTQLNVIEVLGLRTRHMDVKSEIEKYMKIKELPMTSVIVPCNYESLFDMFRPEKRDDNTYELIIPMGPTPLDIIAMNDVGEVVRQIFYNKKTYLNKTISLSASKLCAKEIAAILSKHLGPMKFRDKQLTLAQFRKKFEEAFPNSKLAEDLTHMFDFFIRVDQRCSIDMTKKLNPSLQHFESWVMDNTERLSNILNYPKPPSPQNYIW